MTGRDWAITATIAALTWVALSWAGWAWSGRRDERGSDIEAESAARYARMIGLDLPIEERRALSKALSHGAPTIRRPGRHQ